MRKLKKAKKSDESVDSNGSDEEEKEASESSRETLDDQSEIQEEQKVGTEEDPKIPQTLKQEPVEVKAIFRDVNKNQNSFFIIPAFFKAN